MPRLGNSREHFCQRLRRLPAKGVSRYHGSQILNTCGTDFSLAALDLTPIWPVAVLGVMGCENCGHAGPAHLGNLYFAVPEAQSQATLQVA